MLFSTVVWDGGGSNDNWTTAANWAGGVAPVSGDSLRFTGSARTTANDNYPAGTLFGSIEFASPGFTLTGNHARLSGGITVDAAGGGAKVSLPLSLTGAEWITVASGSMTISGPITGTGAVTKSGAGTLILSGANAYTGGTTVIDGTVDVSGNQSAANGGWTIGNNFPSTPVTVSFLGGSTVDIAAGRSIQISQSAATASPATLNVAGSVTDDGTLAVARSAALNLNGGGNWLQTGALSVGPGTNTAYNSSATINTGSTFNFAGTGTINLSPSTGSGAGHAILSIPGGTFYTGEGFTDSVATSGGAADLYLSNSGILKLSADVASLTSTAGRAFNLQLASGTGTINTNGYDATLAQPITGSGLLNKSGTGVLTLTASSGYSGGTRITAGAILAENSKALGSGIVTIVNGGASTASLQLAGGITISNTFAGLNSEVAGGTPTVENISGNNTVASNLSITGSGGSGAIFQSDAGRLTVAGRLTTTMSTPRTFYFQGSGNGVVSGNITDDSSRVLQLVKAGTGAWTLTGTNSYASGATITAGTLTASGPSVSGTIRATPGGTFTDPALAGAPWTDTNIGFLSLPGNGTFNTGNRYTISGSGAGLAGASDQFNFVYQPFTGDGGITAEVNGSPVNSGGSTIAGSEDGIMFRDNFYTDASFVEVGYTTGSGIQLLYRDGNGAPVQVAATATGATGPVWLRLSRVQGVYTAAYSTNGTTFTTVGTYATQNLRETAFAGMVISSGDNTSTASATFRDVEITSSLVTSKTAADLSFTVPWLASSDTLVYGEDGTDAATGWRLLADVPAGKSSVELTSLAADQAYSIELTTASGIVPAVQTPDGGPAPAGGDPTPALLQTSTNVTLWQVTAEATLTEGITAGDDSGTVAVAHEYVFAFDAMQAAQLAGVSVTRFSSSGNSGASCGSGIYEAGNTGHTAPSYEDSLAQLLGIPDSTPILAVEDGIDQDFNDAFSELTITEI